MTQAPERSSRRMCRRWGLFGVGVGLALTLVWWFPRAGAWLVVEDRFAHAQMALVLSGDPIRRAFAARDLYRQGRIDRILIIPEPPELLEQELVALGLLQPNLPPWPERILVASGVPREKMAFLPEPANGTIVEAMRVRQFLAGHVPESLVLVTSKFSSRRARFIFSQLFHRAHVKIFCYPSSYEAFVATRWWTQPRDALTVVMEYQKLIANAVQLALRQVDG